MVDPKDNGNQVEFTIQLPADREILEYDMKALQENIAARLQNIKTFEDAIAAERQGIVTLETIIARKMMLER